MPAIQEKNKKKWTNDGRSWQYRTYYTDIYGNRKQRESGYYKTRKEAKDAEANFLVSVKNIDEVDSNVSFEFIYNDWLIYKIKTVKSSTYYGIKHRTEKHIFSFFKKYKLHSIKLNIINQWELEMKSKNLSLEYLNTIISYLKEILEFAKDNYDFDGKIVNRIHKYKIETHIKTKNDSEWNYITFEEFKLLLANVDDYRDYMIMYFLYFTGLRPSEMIALNWNDIDFENKKININKTFTNKVENATYLITDPKTKNSIRTIDMDDNLCKLLFEYYNNEKKIYNFNKNMFVFGNAKYISPTTLSRHLNKYIDIIQKEHKNFTRITPHGFRHSHVSLLIYLGCDSRDVAERIGDTVRVVEETYYHMFPNKRSHTVNVLNLFCEDSKQIPMISNNISLKLQEIEG